MYKVIYVYEESSAISTPGKQSKQMSKQFHLDFHKMYLVAMDTSLCIPYETMKMKWN